MQSYDKKTSDPFFDTVNASYGRCLSSKNFLDDFYQNLFSSSPEVSKKFKNTNMDVQKRMVKESITTLMIYAKNKQSTFANMRIEQIGIMHSKKNYDIQTQHYNLWIESLIKTIQKHDPECDQALADMWVSVLKTGIERIKSYYDK